MVSAISSGYAWKHRYKRGAKALILLLCAIGIWGVFYALELEATRLPAKMLWAKLEYLGIVTVPVAWLIFVLRYTEQGYWITRRSLALLTIIPLVTLVLVWTNEAHGLIWSSTALGSGGAGSFMELDYGPWFRVHWVYSYLLLLLGTVLLGSMFSRSSRLYRGQRAALLVAVAAPWLGNVVYVLDLGPLPNLDLTPFGFLLAALALTFGLLRYQFMDLVPVSYRSVVENMGGNVIVVDLEDRILGLNRAAQSILERSTDRVVGQSATQVVPCWTSLLESHRENEEISMGVSLGEGEDQRIYDPVLASLKDSQGEEIGYLLTLQDVTERESAEGRIRELNEDLEWQVADRTGQLEAMIAELRRSEQAISRSEEHFRSLLQHASDIITILDEEGVILYESPAVERILGYTPAEMLGNAALDYVHPEDVERVSEALRERADTEYDRPPQELRFRAKDGTWRHLEVVAKNQLENPSVGGIVLNSRDVTARKQAELELRQTEERYRGLFENAVEGIFQVSKEGRLLTANPSMARILGYDAPERLLEEASEVSELFADPERGARFFGIVQEQGSVSDFESRIRRKDGEVIWASKNARIVYDRAGEVVGYEGSIEDITERKSSQQNIQRSLDMLLALHGAGQVLGSTLQEDEIGSRVLEIMQRVSNLTTVVISTQSEDGELRIWRSVGLHGLWRRARYAPEAEMARNEALDNRHRSFRLEEPGTEGGYLQGLCLPMRVRDRTIGVLEAYGRDMVESEALAILGSLANQAASALENARLYGELEDHKNQLQDLVGKLISAQEEERRRVAYEVHDGLAQVAVAAHQHLQDFADTYPPGSTVETGVLDRTMELVQRTVREARQVIAGLRPTALDDFGLATALRLQVEALREGGWRIDYEEYLDDERLPAEIETSLYRVAQEALTNASKHAQTDRVAVRLERDRRVVRLEIRDWGRGFERDEVSEENGPGERVGLSSMRERVALIGGALDVGTQHGQGTRVTAEVPLTETA